MKTFILLLPLMFGTTIFAAESTVPAFSFSFTMQAKSHTVTGEIVQNCRYEKFVISDSAQYINDYKTYPLKITIKRKGEIEEVTITNEKERFHKVTGWMKPTKTCSADIKLKIESSIYRAWLPTRPIGFQYWSQSHHREYVFWDAQEITNQIEGRHVEFEYVTFGGRQANVYLLTDGQRDFWPSTSAPINPETQMPFLIGE